MRLHTVLVSHLFNSLSTNLLDLLCPASPLFADTNHLHSTSLQPYGDQESYIRVNLALAVKGYPNYGLRTWSQGSKNALLTDMHTLHWPVAWVLAFGVDGVPRVVLLGS
jgi:hypothetical protein